MLWCRMLLVALRLAWPYLLTPWRSPLLRWRMETYGLLDERGMTVDASAITPTVFYRFLLTHPRALMRFLRWAACLPRG